MRERIALGVAALVVLALLALSLAFARAQNPSQEAELTGASGVDVRTPGPAAAGSGQDTTAGRLVYEKRGCARCHSIAGAGNARNPLDGVGSRRTPGELRDWTVGAQALADSLPPSALRAKREHERIPPAELDALLLYLASLREGGL